MPFKMRVSRVTYSPQEMSVSGELVEGSYSGPEVVSLCDRSGRWHSSRITRHEILLPKDWPVVAGDGAALEIHMRPPKAGFELDQAQFILGRGAVLENENRTDISDSISEPGFWVVQLLLHIGSAALPDPPTAWGLSTANANEEYARRFERHWDAGTWPFVRLPLDGSRYIEIEYAAGIEYQNRVWIGEIDGPRVLMGYDSGHFSFPSFRMVEVLALAEQMRTHPSAPLLLLPGTYLMTGEVLPGEKMLQWVRDVPGIKIEFVEPIVNQLSKGAIRTLQWTRDEPFGWINNWKYSQRNPESPMSILTTDDFRYIERFF